MSTPDARYQQLLQRVGSASTPEEAEQAADLLHARYLELERGSTTPGMLPYPDPTDPVAEGADAIRALAEGTEQRYGSGTRTFTVNRGGVPNNGTAYATLFTESGPATTPAFTFAQDANSAEITLQPGVYLWGGGVNMGEFTAGWVRVEILRIKPSVTMLAPNTVPVGNAWCGVVGHFRVNAGDTIRLDVTRQAGVGIAAANVNGPVTITRLRSLD